MARTGNTEPRLSPRLRPCQLWAMANEPDWRPWMHLIASHPNAWPELTAWASRAQDEGFDLAGMAPKPSIEDSWLVRRFAPSTPEPPLTSDDDTPEEGARVRHAFPIKTLLAASIAIGLLATIGAGGILLAGTLAETQAERARTAAITDCVRVAKIVKIVKAEYIRLVNGKAKTASGITVEQVMDANTVGALVKALKVSEPKSVTCPVKDVKSVRAATSKLHAQIQWYTTHKASLSKAVRQVHASKLDKIIDSANTLLADSDGKVADSATRDELLKAIEARGEQAIADAIVKVNESVTAKQKADEEEAKARAEAEAEAAQAAAGVQQSYSSYNNYSSGAGSGGSSGSSSGGGGWEVPAPAGEDTLLPGVDPGL